MDWLKKIDMAMTTDKGELTFTFVLFAMILGCILSWICLFFQKKVVGALVRALRDAGAIEEKNARTAGEVGQDFNVSALHRLERESSLSRVVGVVDVPFDEKGRRKIPPDAKLFLYPEALPRAERQYNDRGINLFVLIAGVVGILAVGVLLFLGYSFALS